jgi:hypothetical protein
MLLVSPAWSANNYGTTFSGSAIVQSGASASPKEKSERASIFLQRAGVPLDYDTLFHRRVVDSITSTKQLVIFARSKIQPGCYSVGAGQDDIQHCFVLLVLGEDVEPNIIDAFYDEELLHFVIEKLSVLGWIDRVEFIHLMALAQPKKRQSKSKAIRRRVKRAKLETTS